MSTVERIIVGGVALTARALASAGGEITLLQWRVLVVTADAPDGLHVGEIGRRIGTTPPSATRVIRRMERQALVVLTRQDTDRRHVLVTLSPEGHRLREAVMAHRRTLLAARLAEAGMAPGPEDDRLLRAVAAALDPEP